MGAFFLKYIELHSISKIYESETKEKTFALDNVSLSFANSGLIGIIGKSGSCKSTLINKIANRNAASTQNKPGHTKAQQWIKVNKDFELLDTPGVLPMSYENKDKATKLALLGSIKEEILPNSDLCMYLLKFFKDKYPLALKERFDIEEIGEYLDVMNLIAKRRGLLKSGVEDIEKAESLLLHEFKNGKLGRMTLEWLIWR